MRIPAALQRWAAAHTHQLSTETRAELNVISSVIGASSLRERDIGALTANFGDELREIFPEDRAARAEGLIRVVGEWAKTQPPDEQTQPIVTPISTLPPSSPSPGTTAPTTPTPVVASPSLPPIPPRQANQPQANQPRGAAPVVDLSVPAPAFLGSDRVDEDDNQRLFGSARSYARVVLALISVIALAAVGVGVWWWATTRTEDPAAVADTVEAESSTDAAVAAITPTPTATPIPSSETPPQEWAEIESILNGGTSQILASTYHVSAANRAVLTGHTAGITGIAVSDEGRVLTSGADARLVDWGAEVTLDRPDVLTVDAPLTVLTRTLDQRIVAGDSLGNLIVFDLVGDDEPQVVAVHDSALSAITELRDGRLAVASVDGDVDVLALQAPADALELIHPAEVTQLVPLVDGRVVSASVDGAVRIWPATGGPAAATITTMNAPVTALAVFGDQLLALGSIDGRIQIVDPAMPEAPLAELNVQSGRIRSILPLTSVEGLNVLAVGGDDSMIRIVDLNNGSVRATLAGHGDLVTAFAELPDGQLVSTSGDATARVWDLDLALRDTRNPAPPHATNLSHLAPWQSNRFITGGTDGVVTLSSTVEGTPSDVLTAHPAPIVGVVVMPNSDVVSIDATSTLRLTQPGVAIGDAIELSLAPGATTIDNRGDLGVVTGHADGTVRFSDFTAEVASVAAHESGVNVVVGLENGLVVSGGDDGAVRIIDLESAEAPQTVSLHQSPVTAMTELPDGRVASAGADGIYVWSVDDLGAASIRLTGHRERTLSLVALDTRRLVSTAADGRLRLWNLDDPTGEPETILDIPGVVNPILIPTETGLLVAGAGRGFVTLPAP